MNYIISSITKIVYIVSSYDFGGSSDINIHIITNSLQKAREVYNIVLVEANKINEKNKEVSGTKYLVELTEVPSEQEFIESKAIKLFWGKHAIMNNNNN